MRESITQEFDYGCAIACIAYGLEITYISAAELVGKEQANSTRFYVKDITNFLNSNGQSYKSIRVKQKNRKSIYKDGAIVLIRRSRLYPTGHYLIRCNDTWMDPWINMPYEKDISKAKSGFRKRLPGDPMYAILPSIPVQ